LSTAPVVHTGQTHELWALFDHLPVFIRHT